MIEFNVYKCFVCENVFADKKQGLSLLKCILLFIPAQKFLWAHKKALVARVPFCVYKFTIGFFGIPISFKYINVVSQ